MSSRSIVTGAAGFIGSTLAERLHVRGWELHLIDDLSTGTRQNLGPLARDLVVADISTDTGRYPADTLFHLAAQVDVATSVADPARDAAVNVVGTVNVVANAIEAGASTIVFTSSCALYGNEAPIPTPESAPPDPASPYGLAKWAGERYVDMLTRSHGVRGVYLAPANVFGPRQRADGEGGVVAIFLSRMLRGEPTTIFGDGSQTRDFVYVEDVADAFIAAAETDSAVGRFNVGTSEATTVLELWELCASLTGYKGRPHFTALRPGEVTHSRLDAARARTELGWKPRVALGPGLKRTADWMDDHLRLPAQGSPQAGPGRRPRTSAPPTP